MPDPMTVPESEDTPRSDFMRAKPNPGMSSRIRENLAISKAAKLNPATEATYVESAKRLGVPVATTRHLPPEQLDPNEPNPAVIADKYPALSAFMAQSASNATLAKGDWKALANIEEIRSAHEKELELAKVKAQEENDVPTLGEAWDFGDDTARLATAYQQNYFNGNPQYMEWAKQTEEKRAKYAERAKREGMFHWLMRSATEQAPVMGGAIKSGLGMSLAGGLTGAATAAVAGQVGPQVVLPEELITVPALAATGATIGMRSGMTAEYFRISSAFAAHELAQIKNMEGQPALDPFAVKAAGVAVGALSAGLEMFGFSKLMKTVPGINNVPFFDRALKSALSDQTVANSLSEVGKRYATAVGAEMSTEMGQESAQIIANWISANLAQLASNAGAGDKQDLFTEDKTIASLRNLSRVAEAGKQAFAASIVLGSPGTAISAMGEAKKIQDMKQFNILMKDVNKAVQEAVIASSSPEKMREFLQASGNTGETFITPEHAAELSPEIMAKLGVTQEQVAEAAEVTGHSIPVLIEDLHSKLTPEEFKQVMPGLKSGMTNPSEVEAENFDKTKEFARATEVASQKAIEEKQFQNSLNTIRKETVKAASELPELREQIRAQGITAKEYADTVVSTLEAMSNRLAMEGRERNEMLRKMTIGAVRQKYAFRGGPILKEFRQDKSRATQLQAPARLDYHTMAKNWRKAHGDRTPVDAAGFSKLADKSDAIDRAKGLRQDGDKKSPQGRTLVVGNIEGKDGAAPTSTSDQAYIVDLFDGANLSTLLHEASHVFLEEMRQIVTSEVASNAMSEEWASLTKWLGVDLASPTLSEADYVKAHEQFARGFEEYLREGNAPNKDLTTAFERFKKWLTKIYKTVADLGPDRVELTDEVRATFGRLLTTEADTDAAVADSELVIRTDADLKGLRLGKEEKAKILELLEQGRLKTEQSLQRRRDKSAKARESAWKKQAEDEVLSRPVYQAMTEIIDQGGLPWARIEFDHGPDTVKELRSRRLVATQETSGADPAIVAEHHGFPGETELIIALLDAEPSRKAAVDKFVAEQKAQHDAQFNAVESLTDAKEYAEYMELMGTYLGRALGQDAAIKQAAFAEVAKNRLANMPMREAMKPEAALAAMQMALKTERRAVAAGDYQTALNANERARLNFELAKQSRKLKKDYDRTMRTANENARADKGTIEEQHHLNLVAILDRYGMLQGKPKVDISKADPLSSLVQSHDSDASDPSALFPDWIINGTFPQGAKSALDMSGKEFEQVHNALWFLNGRGRDIVKDLLSDGKTTADAQRDACMKTLSEVKDKPTVAANTWWGKLVHGNRAFHAGLDHFITLMKAADNYTNVGPKGVAGPNEVGLFRPGTEAHNRKALMQKELQTILKPVIVRLRASMLKHPKYVTSTGVKLPDILKKKTGAWTTEHILCVALNMGNEYNREALASGYGMSDSEIVQLTSILTDADWDDIQTIWDGVNSLWPEIDAVHYRMNHFHLEKVEAKAFRTASGKMIRGGYYPVKFDSDLSDQVSEWTEKDDFMNSTHALHPQPSVHKSFVHGRTGTGGKPINLSLKVLGSHLDFATQYITHAEIVRDLDRVMTARHGKESNPYKKLFAQKFGDEAAALLQNQLKYIARPEGEKLEFFDRIIEANRGPATAFILGYNVKSSLTNLTGVTNILSEVGAGNYMAGFGHVVKSPMEAYQEMVRLSPYMANRASLYERDIKKQLYDLDVSSRIISRGVKDGVHNSAFALLWAGDLAMTMPAWWGVYLSTMAKTGGNVADSVYRANEAIASTNPSARPIDLGFFQRSNKGYHRLFTMFSSFTIKYGNRQRLHYNAWKAGKLSGYDYSRMVVLEAMLPSLMMTIGYALLWGDDPTDEENVKHTIASLAIYQFQGMPFVRDVASAAIGKLAGERFIADPTKSPIWTGYEVAQKVVGSAYRMVGDLNDDKKMEAAIWAFVDLTAYRTGLPRSNVFKNINEGMRQMEEEGGTIFNPFVPDPDKKQR